jgi:TetR/AcrR family transcriptional regulator, transcriptional repressor for nem operon
MVGEPKTAGGRERKRAIVEAAAALVYERGVRATSMGDVGRAAGVGKGQLYHYFSGREELLGAVLDHQLDLVLGEYDGFRTDTWSGLRRWFDGLLVGQQSRGFGGCPVGSLAAEMSIESEALRVHVARAFGAWESSLAASLARMKKRGALSRSARPCELAQVTLAAIQGGYLLSSAAGDIRPMKRALSAAYGRLRAAAGPKRRSGPTGTERCTS